MRSEITGQREEALTNIALKDLVRHGFGWSARKSLPEANSRKLGFQSVEETTKKSPESGIANTIILTCDVARPLPSRVHVT